MYYSNQGANESSFLIGQQNNSAPSPYFGQSTAYCSQNDKKEKKKHNDNNNI
jgi:hypothetical protein